MPISGAQEDKILQNKLVLNINLNDSFESILCCAGSNGAGKTTLQNRNAKWFCGITKGISIVISLSEDDPMFLPYDKEGIMEGDPEALSQFVAIRILYRLLRHYLGIEKAKALLSAEGPLVGMISKLLDPALVILKSLPILLGASHDTAIMLVIDNIPSYDKDDDTLHYFLAFLQRHHCCICEEKEMRLHLSVAFRSMKDIGYFLMHFGQLLLFQPLPPMLLNNNVHSEHSPLILRPFFDQPFRQQLPRSTAAYRLVNDLVGLFTSTGGNPKRISILFEHLKMFPEERKYDVDQNEYPTAQVTAWLNAIVDNGITRYEFFIKELTPRYSGDSPIHHIAQHSYDSPVSFVDVIEYLAIDAVKGFDLKNFEFDYSIKQHKATRDGHDLGYWTVYMALPKLDCYCLLPMCILESLPNPNCLKRSGKALVHLRDALKEWYVLSHDGVKNRTGDTVITAALLLLSNSVSSIRLSHLCEQQYWGPAYDICDLICGPNVDVIYETHEFPLYNSTSATEGIQLATNYVNYLLNQKCIDNNGVLSYSSDNLNNYGIIVGLFKTPMYNSPSPHFVLLIIQTYDLFYKGTSDDMISQWRKNKENIPESAQVFFKGKNATVLFNFLLFVGDQEVPTDVMCARNEGIATLKTIKNWCPTAGYGLEFALSLQKLFAFE